ncbi:MAG: right-handed parallel beta-helix repeat-containing protein [Chloroflexi bacterium]|nr:right-handed parallel beta-helix repeat-containing protein [Chloroflexota bacterium]
MKNRHSYIFLSLTVVFVFVFSLFSTAHDVLADDSTPPPLTEEPALPPTQEPVATEIPTQEPVVPEDVSVGDILAQVPEGTDLIVLDENGEVQSLASQEAADILVNGDPQWCMDGYTPADDPTGGTYCTAKFSSFNGVGGLIEELTNFTGIDSGNGTIYVAYDYVTPSIDKAGIIFDYGDNGLGDLVFQGGWDFDPSSANYNTVVGTTTFTLDSGNYLEFWDWGAYGFPASLTLRDIIIDGGAGLYIGDVDPLGGTTADVNLENVDVTDTEYGAYIETEGDVTVTDGTFSENGDTGLFVESGGDITISDVIAEDNYETGAVFDDSCGCTTGNIFISNSSFNSNGQATEGRGLIAHSNGDITLTDVTANGNGGGGAELINCFLDFFGSFTCLNTNLATITLNGTNTFMGNGYNPPEFLGSGIYASVGLWVGSNSDVSISGTTVQANGVGDLGGGALFFSENGNIFIEDSSFNENCLDCGFGFGFVALDLGGNVTLNGVTANGTGTLYNDPYQGAGGMIINLGGDTVINNSNFNGNCSNGDCSGMGLAVFSAGKVSLNNVTGNGNGTLNGAGIGVTINSGGDIDITCSNFNDNFGYGVQASTSGVLTLNGVAMTGNTDGPLDFSDTLVVNPFNCAKKKTNTPGLPLNLVPVASGQTIELDCEHYGGTKLILGNGNSLTLPCPIDDSASLIDVSTNEDLSKPLPDGIVFQSGFITSVSRNGEKLGKLTGYATISFTISDGVDVSKLVILFWNGTAWVEVENPFIRNDPVTGKSYFEAYVNDIGTFVLAQK